MRGSWEPPPESRRRAAVLALLVCLVLCWPVRAGALRVRLTEKDGPGASLAIHVGDEVTVELPAQLAAGYNWRQRKAPQSVLAKLGETTRTNGGGLLASTGTQRFSWRAATQGTATLVLEYGRVLADGAQPEKIFEIQATVASGMLPATASADLTGPVVIGRYVGTLPCADCSGIREELTLYARSATRSASDMVDTAYLLRRDYDVGPNRSHLFVETGAWQVVHGTPGDAQATIYRLHTPGSESLQDFKVEGAKLVPLDAQGVPIASPASMDLSLHRQE